MIGSITGLLAVIGGIIVAIVVGLSWRPRFAARPVLNKSEIRLGHAIARMLPNGCHLLAQVSYGEMLTNRSRGRYMSVNAKRADLVICNRAFIPILVIEYQGAGHAGSSWRAKLNTAKRDRQKRQALKEAGIPLIEVPARYRVEDLSLMVQNALTTENGDTSYGLRPA